jgi:hypothetical protein
MGNLPGLQLVAHKSAGYTARTCHNAAAAGLTAAFALDFETAGERLTRRMAGERYVAISLELAAIDAARMLYRALKKHDASTLNIAGNGLHPLARSGWTQARCNQYLYEVLSTVQQHWPLEQVISGGQTGADVAGGVAAAVLGIDVVMTFPAGFIQRGVDGVDRTHSAAQVFEDVGRMIDGLRGALQGELEAPEPGVPSGEMAEVAHDPDHVTDQVPRGG